MFCKKNNENIIFFLLYSLIIFSFLYIKNSLFSEWSDILDQDVTLIYNALLIGSNIPQEYLDHPAYTTIFLLNIFFKFGNFFNLIEIKNIEELLSYSNKNLALQQIHNFAQAIHIAYSLVLALLLKSFINLFLKDHLSSFILSIIFVISPSFIFLFDIIRSEILSLIFFFLFYLCLDRYLNKNFIYIFFAGIFFTLSLLAKVQIIICIVPLLIFFFLHNYKKNIKIEKYNIPKSLIIFLNIFFLIFIVYFIDNFFYTRIDKIVFIFLFIVLLFLFAYFDNKKFKQTYNNLSLIVFFIGCITIIFFLKTLSWLGITYFHPALLDLITSPIHVMSNISTGYATASLDNFSFILKIMDFFYQVLTTSDGVNIKFKFLLSKFNIFIYLISIFMLLFSLKKKKYENCLIIVILNILITSIILIFNFRPYHFYDIYILPFHILLISIIIKEFDYKKIFSLIILFVYISLNFSNISAHLDQERASGWLNKKIIVNHKSSMNFICRKENIINKSSYMRYWHRRYDENFFNELCLDYFNKYK